MPLIRTQDGRFKIRNVPGVGTKEEKTKQLQAIKASQKGQAFAEESLSRIVAQVNNDPSKENFFRLITQASRQGSSVKDTFDLYNSVNKEFDALYAARRKAESYDAKKEDVDRYESLLKEIDSLPNPNTLYGDLLDEMNRIGVSYNTTTAIMNMLSKETFAEEKTPSDVRKQKRRAGETVDELVEYLTSNYEDPKETEAYQQTLGYLPYDLKDMTKKERRVILSALVDVMMNSEPWRDDCDSLVYDMLLVGIFTPQDLEDEQFLEFFPESRATQLAEEMLAEDEEARQDQEETDEDLRDWGLMSEAPEQDSFSEFSDEMVDDLYESLDNKEDFLIKLEDHFPDLFVYQGDVKKAIDAYVIEKGNPDGLNEKDLRDVAEEEIEHGLRLTELIPIFDTNIPSPNFFSFEKTLIDSESLEPEKTSAVINKAQQYLVDWYNEEFPDFRLKRPIDVTFEELDTQMTSKVPTLRIEHELSSEDEEQKDGYIDAFVDEEVDPEGRIGFVNYVYDKEADALEVQAVEVMKDWRRQGVATEMYKGLMKLYPGARILNGFQTSKGKKFRKSFDTEFDVKNSEAFAEVSSLASALSSRPSDLSLLQELSKEDSRRGGSLRKALNDYNSAIRSSSDSGSYHRALLREDALLSALKDAGVSKASVGKVVDAIKGGRVDTFAEGDSVDILNSDPTNKELIRRFLNEDDRAGGSLRDQINDLAKMNQDLARLEQDHYVLERRVNRGGGPNYSQDYLQSKAKVESLNKKVTRLGIFLESALKRKGVIKPNLVVDTTVWTNDEGEVFAETKPKFKRKGKTICKESCKETKLPEPDFLKPQSFSERVFAVERHANRLLARV